MRQNEKLLSTYKTRLLQDYAVNSAAVQKLKHEVDTLKVYVICLRSTFSFSLSDNCRSIGFENSSGTIGSERMHDQDSFYAQELGSVICTLRDS